MERKRVLAFGRKYQVGNYLVLKFNKTLRKSEVSELRTQMGIPTELRKGLSRAQLPFIKVMAVSGIWSVEFACNTTVYRMIDTNLKEEDEDSITMFHHLFNMWFMDTSVPGDEEYQKAKADAFKAFMERHKAPEVSEEEDKKIVEGMRQDEENKATLIGMAEHIKEGGSDEDE